MLLDLPPFAALDHFAPRARGLTWARAPNGFSGARVWRGTADAPRVALKVWPPGTAPERVRQVHAWLALAAHLPFVPTVFPGAGGRTVFADADHVWDCVRWMPGAPRATPTGEEVAAACAAVARLHDAWSGSARSGPCPGVRNRLRVLAENEPLLASGPGALPPISPLLDPLLRRAVGAAARLAPGAGRALRAWEHRAGPLFPCVRDLRGEHVLFEAGRVSGIIDYGAAAVDHPAVDLARLLADFAEPDDPLFASGLNAYRGARPARAAPDEFVRLLARTGVVCSLLVWVHRLTAPGGAGTDPHATAVRIGSLLARAETFSHI